MLSRIFRHKQLPVFAAVATVFCILFIGMRVPDISRPHRPKPTHRAVIEKQVNPTQYAAKKLIEIVAVAAKPTEILTPTVSQTVFYISLHDTSFVPNSLKLARSPPALLV
jgi:hypothetical protein